MQIRTGETETEHLNLLIRTKFNNLVEDGANIILPSDLAAAVFKIIDPGKKSPVLVQLAAILELRQLSRAVCRRQHKESEENSEQGNLFDFHLQDFYPASRQVNGETQDAYVRRGYLTYGERMRNVTRLRNEAVAKQVHADALLAETEDLVRRGELASEDNVIAEIEAPLSLPGHPQAVL